MFIYHSKVEKLGNLETSFIQKLRVHIVENVTRFCDKLNAHW